MNSITELKAEDVTMRQQIISLYDQNKSEEEISEITCSGLGYVKSVIRDIYVKWDDPNRLITKEKLDDFRNSLKKGQIFHGILNIQKAYSGRPLKSKIVLKDFYPHIATADVSFTDKIPFGTGDTLDIPVTIEMSFRYCDLYLMSKKK